MAGWRGLFSTLRGGTSTPVQPTGGRVIEAGEYRVHLDLAEQVLAVDTQDMELGFGDGGDVPLRAAPELDRTGFVSAAMLAHKAKQFDDGLYAAVELLAQAGAGTHPGKAGLIGTLARALQGAGGDAPDAARDMLLAAASFGDVPVPESPPEIEARVATARAKFLGDPLRSQPIGFYTWSGTLAGIFQQDRMLQAPLERAGAIRIAAAIDADPSTRSAYDHHLQLMHRLTNPPAGPSVLAAHALPPGLPAASLFPASRAHETDIVKELFGATPIPTDFVLMDEMIRRIETGALDLTPRPDSGWYDHQTWALEPLVAPDRAPEAARLALAPRYRTLLRDLFKALMALTRETHVKQLESPLLGSAFVRPTFIDLEPSLSAEPLATHYLRRAQSYRFVRGVLEESFGADAIARAHRLTPEGPVKQSLAGELADIEQLFLGAAVTVQRELGLPPETEPEAASRAVARFAAFGREAGQDEDLRRDARMMVPLFRDAGRERTKVWVFLGWASRRIEVGFARQPAAAVTNARGRAVTGHPPLRWGSASYLMAYPVTAEIYVKRVLNRAEMRSICDECRTAAAILERLTDQPSLKGTSHERPAVRPTCEACGWQPRPKEPAGVSCPRCGGGLTVR